ncbi:hypothetical protein L1887_19686 [Cichorium endivia]|nr:hypothetical protein L1887_19686 [Cichorium endivia]
MSSSKTGGLGLFLAQKTDQGGVCFLDSSTADIFRCCPNRNPAATGRPQLVPIDLLAKSTTRTCKPYHPLLDPVVNHHTCM